jgi:TolB-like protein/DNA-binding winged helix-turn-helix (wHTH) protein
MATPSISSLTVTFGAFEVRMGTGELLKHGIRVRLQRQPFQVLSALLARPGEVISRAQLREQLWTDGTFVEFEHGLNSAINRLREVLGDDADAPRFIETLPRLGYRFIASVAAPQTPLGPPSEPAEPPLELPQDRRSVKWVAAGLAVLIALLLAVAAGWFRRSQDSALVGIRSIAVLPLENLSGDSSQDYFADGITDELITDLAQIHSLRVISRTSVTQFKHTAKRLPEIAAELNVDGVIEGSVVRSGGRVRVTAQLLDARQDRHLWAASFEREMSDIMDLQGELARAIATQVHASITPEEGASLAKKRPTNPESYDALLTGRFLLNRRNGEAAKRAIGYFQRAVALDSRNASAWAALGDCYASLGADLGVARPHDVLPATRAAIAKALELDPNLAEPHATLAKIKLWFDWDWTGAEREYRRAIELNPNESSTHREYAHYLQLRKRFAEALAENKRAIDLAPLDILSSIHLAWLYADAHQGQKAVEQSKRVLVMDPAFTGAYLWLARGYELQAKWSDAIGAYEHARDSYRLAYLAGVAHIWAASGNRPEAQAALARLTAFSRQNYVSPMIFAEYYAGLGDRDTAMVWLERAYREHATGLISLNVNYKWDSLRSDPRFQDLLRRVGFL